MALQVVAEVELVAVQDLLVEVEVLVWRLVEGVWAMEGVLVLR